MTVFMDEARKLRGTILPLKASGHTYGDDVDACRSAWSNVEVRLDERIENAQDTMAVGVNVGDIIAVDTITSSPTTASSTRAISTTRPVWRLS